MYKNADELYQSLKGQFKKDKLDKYEVLTARLILRYANLQGMNDTQVIELKKYLKGSRSNPDLFVPNDKQMTDALNKMTPQHRILYSLFLVSGIRKSEGEHLLENFKTLRIQHLRGFVKINLDSFRKTKNAYVCYLPEWLFYFIQQNINELSTDGLDSFIKRHNLIPVKYARKWFYTKCIELGVPESIADFYEGRISGSIGSNHYLGKQSLADKFYGEILLQQFEMLKNSTTKEVLL